MKVILSDVFPYTIKVSRTANWYDNGGTWYRYDNEGTWYQYATWLDEVVGRGEWEYSIGQFYFKKEEDVTMFTLRWK